jgi:hypothetical protein
MFMLSSLIMKLGVPQLSLGEKAILTATPDYVRLSLVYSLTVSLPFYIGLWLSWLPARDTGELDAEVRSGTAEDQLVDST